MLEFLENIGHGSVSSFWIPVFLWTGLASADTLALKLARGVHPVTGIPVASGAAVRPADDRTGRAVGARALAADTSPVESRPAWGFRSHHPVDAPRAGTLGAGYGHPVDITATLLGVALGAIIVLAGVRLSMLARDLHRLRRLRLAAPPVADPEPNQLLRAVAGRLGVWRPLELLEGPPDSVPMTFGARRPVVVVPPSLLDSPDLLRTVLSHELIHVRRADSVWALLDCLTSAVFAFHPLVWRLRRGIERCRETSCDAEVVAAGIVRTREYAELLAHTHAPTQFPMPAVAASMSARSLTLKERLETMKNFADIRLTSRRRLRAVLGAGLLGLLTTIAAACATRTGEEAAVQEGGPSWDAPAVMVQEDRKYRVPAPIGTGIQYYPDTPEQEVLEQLAHLDVQMEYLRERMDEIRQAVTGLQKAREPLDVESAESKDLWRQINYAQERLILLTRLHTERLRMYETVKMEYETQKRMGDGS